MFDGNPKSTTIDFQSLTKGSIVPQELIESHIGIRFRDDPLGYQLRTLRLRDEIEGIVKFYTRIDGLQIRVLTDQEALIWTERSNRRGANAIRKAHKRHAQVDVSKLNDEEKRQYETTGLSIAANVLALEAVKRERDQARVIAAAIQGDDARITADNIAAAIRRYVDRRR